MKSYNIAVIPGDGTGPEVIREGLKVLDAVIKKFGIKIEFLFAYLYRVFETFRYANQIVS